MLNAAICNRDHINMGLQNNRFFIFISFRGGFFDNYIAALFDFTLKTVFFGKFA